MTNELPLTRRVMIIGAVTAALAGAGLAPAIAHAGTQGSVSFTATGEHAITVPAGVSSLRVDAIGGRGFGPNGTGAEVTADIAVTPGETLYAEVGGDGAGPNDAQGPGAGGWNGGGSAASEYLGGGGGGASDVRICSRTDAGCDTLASRVVVAAGGGGFGGRSAGGNAGTPNGQDGQLIAGAASGGGGATQTTAGTGGIGGGRNTIPGNDGSLGVGGDGGPTSIYGAAGGGGGGGYYGGGGGASDPLNYADSQASGGGGGSSYGPAGATYALASFGDPSITISWNAPGPLDHITLTPTSASIVAGGSRSFSVEGFDASGLDLGDVTTATDFTITPDGSCGGATCTASKAGDHTVTASDGTATATARISVGPAALDHLDLQPANATIAAGTTQTYHAEGFDAFGNDLGDLTAATTLTIAPDGSCTGVTCTATTAGEHTVTATDGNATGTAQLSINPGPPATQTIGFTSTSPDHPVYGDSYTPTATGGASGNPVVFSIDSSSTACSIDAAGMVSFTGVGSCIIDANQAGNDNHLPAEQAQQTLSIAKATLTVTADDQTKGFGDPLPPLTATLRGFANSETLASSGVTGHANCATTAAAMSPGGTYPITCTQGSLSAAHYNFSFADGTLTVTFAETVTGSSSGQLNVGPGQSALIGRGANVSGPVTVQAGSALEIEGARINGPLKAAGPAEIRVCNTTITGPTTIAGANGPVTFGDGTAGCPGNKFTGPVRITNNTGGVIFDHNTITGPLTITGNTGTLPTPHTGTVEAIASTATGKTDIQQR